jgi:hypothetical protein
LLLEEYVATFDYLLGKKNVGTVANDLSSLYIDSVKIQQETEKSLTILSGSRKINISNIK